MASGWMRWPRCSIGLTSGPMASGWPMTRAAPRGIRAVTFLQRANTVFWGGCFSTSRSVVDRPKESTTWRWWTQPTHLGGLGFQPEVGNMCWMHDMLDYFELDPWNAFSSTRTNIRFLDLVSLHLEKLHAGPFTSEKWLHGKRQFCSTSARR